MKKDKLKKIPPQYKAVLIVPIPDNSPVVVFKKDIDAPLVSEECSADSAEAAGLPSQVTIGCESYWQGVSLENRFPEIVKQHYDKSFLGLIELEDKGIPKCWDKAGEEQIIVSFMRNSKSKYDPKNLPKGCFEVSLKYVFDSRYRALLHKKADKERVKVAKKILCSYGFDEDKRGKSPRKNPVREERNRSIINSYKEIVKKTKKKNPYPIKSIQRKLPHKYDVSDATIRRVLDSYTKK